MRRRRQQPSSDERRIDPSKTTTEQLNFLFLFHTALQRAFIHFPAYAMRVFPWLKTFSTMTFVYVLLQALGLLWGFLVNVATNICVSISDSIDGLAQVSLDRAFSIFFMDFAIISIVLGFGRATWILSWQSVGDFKYIRQVIASECRVATVLTLAALPILVILSSLMLATLTCSDESTLAVGTFYHWVCKETPIKFLTSEYMAVRRSMRLALVIVTIQFVQATLYLLPDWKRYGHHRTLTISMCFLIFMSTVWGCEWAAQHFQYQLGLLPPLIWDTLTLVLLIAWILWLTFLARVVEASQKKLSQNLLIRMFQHLKFTFCYGQLALFLRGCVHPTMGFVQAQLELTITSLFLPFLYVFALLFFRSLGLVEKNTLIFGLPIAAIAALVVYDRSGFEEPYAICVLFMFIFGRILAAFCQYSSRTPLIQANPFLRRRGSHDANSHFQMLFGHREARGLVRLGAHFIIIGVCFLCAFGFLSHFQIKKNWYPETISFQKSSTGVIDIKHASFVKLRLTMANQSSPHIKLIEPHYASCGLMWENLTLVDYAVLSQAAYFSNELSLKAFIAEMFPTGTVEYKIRLPRKRSKHQVEFFEFYMRESNTSIISVRGTDIGRFSDFIEDVKMYSEPVVFAILSTIFPTVRIWPDVTTSTMIEIYHELLQIFGLGNNRWYYQSLVDYAATIRDRKVILTGHSLGGGIARIVGSILGKTSVTFSPPGLVQSYSKLVHDIGGESARVDRRRLHHESISVIPEYDPISMIDTQPGLVQRISCSTPHLSMQLSCHMIEGTLCNLVKHCGDIRHRFSSCAFEQRVGSLLEDMILEYYPIGGIAIIVLIIAQAIRRRRKSRHI